MLIGNNRYFFTLDLSRYSITELKFIVDEYINELYVLESVRAELARRPLCESYTLFKKIEDRLNHPIQYYLPGVFHYPTLSKLPRAVTQALRAEIKDSNQRVKYLERKIFDLEDEISALKELNRLLSGDKKILVISSWLIPLTVYLEYYINIWHGASVKSATYYVGNQTLLYCLLFLLGWAIKILFSWCRSISRKNSH